MENIVFDARLLKHSPYFNKRLDPPPSTNYELLDKRSML
jgi:hypothetical protein